MTDQNRRDPRKENKLTMRTLAKKRWFYPAVYLAVAAIVLTGALWFQKDATDNKARELKQKQEENMAMNQNDEEAAPVNSLTEVFKFPVADKSSVDVSQPFYDDNATPEEQQAALVMYDHSYTQNTGINIAAKDGKSSFEAVAALSGTVVKAEKDNLLGYVVKLQHENGVMTYYESLASVNVEEGDHIQQGDVIGKAGENKYNAAQGVHLHFEIRKNDTPVNPTTYFNKGIAALDNANAANSSQENKQPNTDNKSNDNRENENGTSLDSQNSTDDSTEEPSTTQESPSPALSGTSTNG